MNWRWRSLRGATALARGGVVLYPTEGVWGLGCDPANAAALRHLLKLKRRPARKGLILIGADASQLRRFSRSAGLEPPPGRPTTLLVPAATSVPRLVRGQHQSVALRVCQHAAAAALCRNFGGAITSTSANISGFATPVGRWACMRQWGPRVAAVVPGQPNAQAQPSRIFDTVSGQWIRQ